MSTPQPAAPLRVLVLGGYGLIGSEVCRRLVRDGHSVTGLGRSAATGRRVNPHIPWVGRDLAAMTDPGTWVPLLDGVDAVVNCAGALQDAPGTDLGRVHATAIAALVRAGESTGLGRLVQISAAGASSAASTRFLRTKADGDAAIRAGSVGYAIFRPGLVISPAAYGGTALLRALATVPWIQPVLAGTQPIQCVGIDDLADAVALALSGSLGPRFEADLVEEGPHDLIEIVLAFRAWLGLAPPVRVLLLPAAAGSLVGGAADLLGWLGWRSPLRSTALHVLRTGVSGDPEPWRAATGRRVRALDDILAGMPATVQERWFAHGALLAPLALAGLAAFWIASGAIALARVDAAAGVLAAAGVPGDSARASVAATALLDLALGAAAMVRPLARHALAGMVAATLTYLAAATWLVPALWLDPLGPLLKAVPALLLALLLRPMLDTR